MQPTLPTARLLLRAFEPSDAPSVQRLAGEREIALNTALIPHPYPDGAAAEWIAGLSKSFASGASAVFAIVERGSGELVGSIGLTFDRAHNMAELGYWLGKPFWGQGYCTDAGAQVLRYGFEDRELNRVWAGRFGRNVASGRVLEKLGLRLEGILRQHFVKWDEPQDVYRYGILREEWQHYPTRQRGLLNERA
jgi:RimJ/RimL family protein N-acetyltransferase